MNKTQRVKEIVRKERREEYDKSGERTISGWNTLKKHATQFGKDWD